jgi:hypothetical protein
MGTAPDTAGDSPHFIPFYPIASRGGRQKMCQLQVRPNQEISLGDAVHEPKKSTLFLYDDFLPNKLNNFALDWKSLALLFGKHHDTINSNFKDPTA